MPFFKDLEKLKINRISLDIVFSNDLLTVCVVPKNNSNDNALDDIKPRIITNTAEVLDTSFFERISKDLSNTAKAFDNAKAYNAKLDEQKKKTQQAKEQQQKVKKLTDDIKKILEEKTLDDKMKTKASKAISELLKLEPNNTFALNSKKQISQGGLF